MGKRYDAELFTESIAEGGAHGCNYLLTTDMEMEPVRGYRFANWELGYGDFHLVPDLATLRIAAWLPRTALVLCDVHDTTSHSAVAIAPRSILRKQTDAARAFGFDTFAASELEHYLFRTSYADVARGLLRDLNPAGWYLEDYHLMQGARTEDFHGAVRRHLKDSGVPVENSKGEWGRGQHEINVRYADTLTMADRHVVFKQCVKELADSMGLAVTFMAKIAPNQAGSGCHIHFSLRRDGRTRSSATASAARSTARTNSAGFSAAGSPTSPTSWCSTRPLSTRTSATSTPRGRPLGSPGVGTIVRRAFAWLATERASASSAVMPGADCNPYLAFAASLASGLDGIANHTEPPDHFDGDIYAAQQLPRAPYTLADATDQFAASEFAKRAFGDDVVEHYLHFFRSEQRAYDMAVTDWEIQRYFERI